MFTYSMKHDSVFLYRNFIKNLLLPIWQLRVFTTYWQSMNKRVLYRSVYYMFLGDMNQAKLPSSQHKKLYLYYCIHQNFPVFTSSSWLLQFHKAFKVTQCLNSPGIPVGQSVLDLPHILAIHRWMKIKADKNWRNLPHFMYKCPNSKCYFISFLVELLQIIKTALYLEVKRMKFKVMF